MGILKPPGAHTGKPQPVSPVHIRYAWSVAGRSERGQCLSGKGAAANIILDFKHGGVLGSFLFKMLPVREFRFTLCCFSFGGGDGMRMVNFFFYYCGKT